jgi:glycosyltransferase involved in cell wall biosynthesis
MRQLWGKALVRIRLAMHVPRVTIGLPVYNGDKCLRQAVDSILLQDYTDFELIISDNNSDDGTEVICREYAAKDARIHYSRLAVNRGAAPNFRAVFDQARGAYFRWACYDDVCLPGLLRRCVQELDAAPPSVVLVAPRVGLIDENGRELPTPESLERIDTRHRRPYARLADVLRRVQWASAQYGLFRTEALRRTRLIDSFYAADYVLLAELALLGEIWEIPEVLFQRRIHPAVSTAVNRTSEEFRAWFDSSKRVGRNPRVRLSLEYARSINRLEMAFSDRLLCYWTVLAIWCVRHFRTKVIRLLGTLRGKLGCGG